MATSVAVPRRNDNHNFTRNHSSKPRWRGRLNHHKFTIVPNAVIADRRLTSAEYRLFSLFQGMARDGEVEVSIPDLARALGWKDRWTQVVKGRLIAKGYLEETPQFNKRGDQIASFYRILGCTPPVHDRAPQVLHGNSKAQNVKHPAGPGVGSSPAPIPTKPRTRHIKASSRIARRFADERHLSDWERLRLSQRIEDRLNAGEVEEVIVADLDREYRARQAAADRPHRSTWRKRSRNDRFTSIEREAATMAAWNSPERKAQIDRETEEALRMFGGEEAEEILRKWGKKI